MLLSPTSMDDDVAVGTVNVLVIATVCGPEARLLNPLGLVHTDAAPPSIAHVNVAPASSVLNENCAVDPVGAAAVVT